MKLINSVLGVLVFAALVSCDQFKITKTEDGDRLQVHEKGESGKLGKDGDILTFDLVIKSSLDTVFKNTYKEGQPFRVPLRKGQFKGSFENALYHIAEGDSTTVLVSADSLFNAIQQTLPTGVTKGSDLLFTVKMRKIQTMKEFEQELEEKKANEGKYVDEYAAKNLKNATKTADGIQYVENLAGSGATPAPGDSVIVKYVGKFMEGRIFDQSPADQPFIFTVGTGSVIPGWDKALQTMKKGGKSTFIIPSRLAYGENGAGGVIPPNTPLVFEIELIDVKK